MLNRTRTIIFWALFFVFLGTAQVSLAKTNNTTNNNATAVAAAPVAPTNGTASNGTTAAPPKVDPGSKVHYCPPVEDLRKDGLFWKAYGSWKSYSQSFAPSLKKFIGAQWLGVNVGKIICLYQGKSSFDFPVSLEPIKTFLIAEPKAATWKKEKSGATVCGSSEPKDCPFFLLEEKKTTDIYKELRYKGADIDVGGANSNN